MDRVEKKKREEKKSWQIRFLAMVIIKRFVQRKEAAERNLSRYIIPTIECVKPSQAKPHRDVSLLITNERRFRWRRERHQIAADAFPNRFRANSIIRSAQTNNGYLLLENVKKRIK